VQQCATVPPDNQEEGMAGRVEGKIALVTGGAQGLGEAAESPSAMSICPARKRSQPHSTRSARARRQVHAIDLDGVFLGCKHAIGLMARTTKASNLGGSIVNISSISGIIAGHNMAAYNSAKAGVRHLSKSVALYCAKKGLNIRSNSIHPVFIATPILDGLVQRFGKEEAYAKLARQVPMGKIGEPDDIAYAVLYLASDEAKFVTGAELKVDGGISAM
jgi:NAD(P)-dependent dehydrogenase (short-subunit alcohol dehydrogenase family)